jgi:hypothetical protein
MMADDEKTPRELLTQSLIDLWGTVISRGTFSHPREMFLAAKSTLLSMPDAAELRHSAGMTRLELLDFTHLKKSME